MKTTLLCILNTSMLALGQILFKYGSAGKKIESIVDIIKLFFNPVILAGLFLYACTTGLWLYILSRTPISFAYPFQALAFPVVLLVSVVLFKEEVSAFNFMGVGLICVGVFLATR